MTNANDCAYPADNQTQSEGGLTKREYLAALAMQGLSTDKTLDNSVIVTHAVLIADALINELNKQQP